MLEQLIVLYVIVGLSLCISYRLTTKEPAELIVYVLMGLFWPAAIVTLFMMYAMYVLLTWKV